MSFPNSSVVKTLMLAAFLVWACPAPSVAQDKRGEGADRPTEKTYDLRRLAREIEAGSTLAVDRTFRAADERFGSNRAADGMIDSLDLMIRESVARNQWRKSGGKGPTATLKNGVLIVVAAPAVHDEMRALLADIAKVAGARPGRRANSRTGDEKPPREKSADEKAGTEEPAAKKGNAGAATIVIYDIRNLPARTAGIPIRPGKTNRVEAVETLATRIQDEVLPKSWMTRGGADGNVREIGGLLIIRQSPAAHAAIQTKLAEWAH